MKIVESLKAISIYPIPQRTLDRVAVERGLQQDQEATSQTFTTKGYQLATADLMDWLSNAPNISEGGVSFSLSQQERESFKRKSKAIYQTYGIGTESIEYGYAGSEL